MDIPTHNIKTATSDDYDDFHLFDFNRTEINQRHVRKLRDLIRSHGFIGIIIVIKTSVINGVEQLFIGDGQHRFLAIKDLEIPFPYIVVEKNSLEEITKFVSALNSNSMPWSLEDYLYAWSKVGIDSYRIVKNKYETSGLSISLLINFYGLRSQGGRGSRFFKEGTFSISDLSTSTSLIETFQEARSLMRFEHWTEEHKFADWIITNRPDKDRLVSLLEDQQTRTLFVEEEMDELYYN